MSTTFLFTIFSTFLILSSFMVILSRNPMYSILFLILCFCSASCLLLSIELEYLPLVFLVIYVGAIAVLFIFVVMMLNIRFSTLKEQNTHFVPIGLFLLVFFILGFNFICRSEFAVALPCGSFISEFSLSLDTILSPSTVHQSEPNMKSLGFLIYSEFYFAFIVSGYILLLAMVGAINLTLQKKFEAKITSSHLQTNLHN